jgi:hypothetical protein
MSQISMDQLINKIENNENCLEDIKNKMKQINKSLNNNDESIENAKKVCIEFMAKYDNKHELHSSITKKEYKELNDSINVLYYECKEYLHKNNGIDIIIHQVLSKLCGAAITHPECKEYNFDIVSFDTDSFHQASDDWDNKREAKSIMGKCGYSQCSAILNCCGFIKVCKELYQTFEPYL